MAKIDMSGIDELLAHIDNLAERAAKNGAAAVKAGGEAAKAAMQAETPVRTGGLRGSVAVSPVKYNSVDGYSCEVGPEGKRADGESYARIGSVLEYGRSNMAAKPWMRPAIEKNGEAIAAEIGRVLMEE